MSDRVVQIGARLITAAIAILGVLLLVFLLVRVVPGDPVEAMLGEQASAADRAALKTALGLDRPLAVQWIDFLRGLCRGDLGASLVSGEPIAAMLGTHARATALLAGAALAFAVAVGLPLGVLAAVRLGGAWDRGSAVLAVLGMSVPSFVLGPLLILLFAVTLGWLPSGGAEHPAGVVLPALTLGVSLAAFLARLTRAALLEVLAEPYVLAARARGLAPRRVLLNHAVRNAALPILTALGLQCGGLLGGAVVTEVVFAWPGLGQLVVEAIQRRDYPVVQAGVLVIAIAYVVVNTATDVLAARCDPRLADGR